MPEESPVNTDDPALSLYRAQRRVRGIQAKLHQWAIEDEGRRFDDLFNLVCDPAFLHVAWDRVRHNAGGRSPGVDWMTAHDVEQRIGGVDAFLREIRDSLKARVFRPLPVRERMIPKPGTSKKRRLGIPTVRDRVVQAALKLVMEPVFEADFAPGSYGFRPNRRAQDAIAEIHLFGTSGYHWVLDADIEACFDSIDHTALMDRVRHRVGDKWVLALVKAFLKSGVLTEFGDREQRHTGTPQGGILSPLLANIALSALDEHFFPVPDRVTRNRRRRHGLGNYRLIRYADDFVVMVDGSQAHVHALREEVSAVLAPMGLTLSAEKTTITHVDEGFDFLGFRIQRKRKRGTRKHYIYTFPSKKSIQRVKDKIRTRTGRTAQPAPGVMIRDLNQLLRGWCNYFRHGVSKHVFSMLNSFSWRRATRWLRKWHQKVPWRVLSKRYIHHPNRWDITTEGITLFRPSKYQSPGTATEEHKSPHRGPQPPTPTRHDPVESRMLGNGHVRFGGRTGETDHPKGWHRAPVRPYAERHGLAQRYYLTALRAAHNANDKALGAHVLSAMANHAARREQAADAISLGTAAVELAHRSPAIVQALVSSQLAYGYAVGGDAERFHAAHGRARELVEDPTGHRPRWAYYVSPQNIDALGGRDQVSLGMAGSRNSRRHLGHAITLLTPSVTAAADQPYQRDALLRRTWLARAHVGRKELEQACEMGRTALEQLPHVTSPRCLTSLRRLADELRARKLNPHVRDFSAELDRKLQLATA